jgi:hypothetical protein
MSRRITRLKVVIQLIRARRPYYAVRYYESGRLILQAKRVVKPDYILRWFLYNQSLLDQGLTQVKRRASGTVQITFSETVERHFKVFLLYVYSILNIRSSRRVDCLARCWSRLDVVSPVVDVLWELSRITDVRRFSGLLRGYCLCR